MIVIEPGQFTEPQDHLGNAALARKLTGHYQAIELEQLAAFARSTTDLFPTLEVSTLLHISDRAAERRLQFALELTTRLPTTLAMLKQGRIEEYKAQLITEAVKPLSDEHTLAVEARVLDKAPAQTPAQLCNALARAVLAVDPLGAEERRQERVATATWNPAPPTTAWPCSPSTTAPTASPPPTASSPPAPAS